MYFVPHFGHAKVYETSIWTPCFQISAKTLKGGSQYTHISTIDMYKFIKIRHDIIKQCHGNYKEVKIFNYKLEIEIFRNSAQLFLGVLRGSF